MVKHQKNVDHKLSACSPIHPGLTKRNKWINSDENDHPIAFIPKAMINLWKWQVFWLACFLKPSHLVLVETVAFVVQKVFFRLTAAGTAPDLHRIPMFVLVDRKSISEPFPAVKVEIFTTD